MTAQQVFDKAVGRLLKQGVKSTTNKDADGDPTSPRCMYRKNEKPNCRIRCVIRCVIGGLILDSEYNPDMEDKSVKQLINHCLLPARLIPHEGLLVQLQACHDDYDINLWRETFEEIAKEKNLKWNF